MTAALLALCVAQPDPAALALQRAVHAAIDRAEPAIACVLVSRSAGYRQFGAAADIGDAPGRLGAFDARPFRNGPGADRARRLDLSDPEAVPEAFGTGVVIDRTGLILTCYHVVEGATKVFVRLPGRAGSYADIHAADPRADLAVLRLQRPPPGLAALDLGDGGTVRKGDWVVSLANPFAAGFRDGSPSASWGIVSNVRRRAPGDAREELRSRPLHQYGTLIQTDARLNLGSSGGALLALDGTLVGLTTSVAALAGGESAGGYALPMDRTFRRIVGVLREGREVEYGFLGVAVGPSPPPSPRGGLEISQVTSGSPAAAAGVRAGDVLLAIDDSPIREADDLFLYVGASLAGTEIRLRVRNPFDGERTLKARLAKARFGTPGIASVRAPTPLGIRVDYTTVLLDGVRGGEVPPGVLLSGVDPGGPAAAKLKPLLAGEARWLVTHVNGTPVSTPAEFAREASKEPRKVALTLADAARPEATRVVEVP